VETEKLGGVAGGEGECGDDVAGLLVRERWNLDILLVKKKKQSAVPGELVGSGEEVDVLKQKRCGTLTEPLLLRDAAESCASVSTIGSLSEHLALILL